MLELQESKYFHKIIKRTTISVYLNDMSNASLLTFYKLNEYTVKQWKDVGAGQNFR